MSASIACPFPFYKNMASWFCHLCGIVLVSMVFVWCFLRQLVQKNAWLVRACKLFDEMSLIVLEQYKPPKCKNSVIWDLKDTTDKNKDHIILFPFHLEN